MNDRTKIDVIYACMASIRHKVQSIDRDCQGIDRMAYAIQSILRDELIEDEPVEEDVAKSVTK